MVSLTDYAGLADELVIDISGAQPGLLIREINLAARELCRETGVWRQELDAVETVDGQTEYVLDVSDYTAEIRWVEKVEVDGNEIHPTAWTYNRPGRKIVLESEKEAGLDMVATVVLAPLRESTGLPEHIIEDYGHVIVAFAKSRLYAMPKRPWTDGQLAGYWMREKDRGIDDIKRDMIIDGHEGDMIIETRFIV